LVAAEIGRERHSADVYAVADDDFVIAQFDV
jgi:hypothetical protein